MPTPYVVQLLPRRSNPIARTKLPTAEIIGLALYIVMLGTALAILPPVISLILGVLPLGLLYLNQTWDFRAPYELLHLLIVGMFASFLLWPRYMAFNVGGPDITPSRILNAILLLVWSVALLSPSYRKELSNLMRNLGLWSWLLATYVIFRIASGFGSEVPLLSLYQTANELLTAVVILPMALSLYRDCGRLDKLMTGFLFAGILIAIIAIVEKIAGHNLFANVHIPGVQLDSEWVQQSLRDKMRTGQYRAQATFMHPLVLTEFLVFSLPLSLYFLARPQWRWRLLGGSAFLLFVAGTIATGSRASFVAVPPMVIMAIVLFSLRRRPGATGGSLWIMTLIVVGLTTLAGVVLLTLGTIDLSVLTGRDINEVSSTYNRLLMIQRGLPQIAEHPVLGYGPGLSATKVGIANARGEATIDNYYLSLALDSGLPALAAFVTLSFGMAAKGYLAGLRNPSREGLLCGLLATSLTGMLIVKSILSIPHNAPIVYLIYAVIGATTIMSHKTERRCKSSPA